MRIVPPVFLGLLLFLRHWPCSMTILCLWLFKPLMILNSLAILSPSSAGCSFLWLACCLQESFVLWLHLKTLTATTHSLTFVRFILLVTWAFTVAVITAFTVWIWWPVALALVFLVWGCQCWITVILSCSVVLKVWVNLLTWFIASTILSCVTFCNLLFRLLSYLCLW